MSKQENELSSEQDDDLIESARKFVEQHTVAMNLAEDHKGEIVVIDGKGVSLFVEAYVIGKVESWNAGGKEQRGWALHPADDVLYSDRGLTLYSVDAVAFEDIGRDVVPKIGDVVLSKRIGGWAGYRHSIEIVETNVD